MNTQTFKKPWGGVDKACSLIIFASYTLYSGKYRGFAPAGATKGLSDRPLETFGPIHHENPASSGA